MLKNIFYLFIFTLPFMAFRVFAGLKIPEVLFILLLMLSFFYVATKKKTVFYFPVFLYMFLFFVFVCFLSVLLAPQIPAFMYNLEWATGINAPEVLAWTSLIRVFLLFMLVFFIANFVKERTELEKALKIFVCSGAFVGLISIFQTINLIMVKGLMNMFISFSSTHMGDMPRVSGFMSEPGGLSEYLLVSVIITIALLIKESFNKKKYYALLLVQMIALFFTFSTRGWMAFVLGTLLFIVLNLKYVKKTRVSINGFMIFVIIIPFVTAAFVYMPGLNKISGFVIEKTFLSQGGGVRMHRRDAAMKMVLAYPLLGVGIGNYPYFHGQYLDYDNIMRNPEINPYNGKKTAASDYYQIFSETGVLGITLLMLMMIALIMDVIKSMKDMKDNRDKLIYKAILSSLFGAAFAYSVGTSIWASIYFWFLIGLVLAYRKIIINENSH